jgi:hypothetical protein
MDTYTDYLCLVELNLSILRTSTGRDWSHGWTGGNCDAFFLNDGDNYHMVTVGGEAIAPTTPEEWAEITLGYYTPEDDGGQIVEAVTTLHALVDFFKNKKGA